MKMACLALLKDQVREHLQTTTGLKGCKESACRKPLYGDVLGVFYAND